MTETDLPPAVLARRVMRATDRATLATLMRAGMPDAGAPYASLVLVAFDHDASPLLLLSTLADHTRNLLADPQVSLLFDGTSGLPEPLAGPRVSLQGRIAATTDASLRARYLARHPGASFYAGFADFAFYRVTIDRAHLVAGFGAIHWIEAHALCLDAAAVRPLGDAEAAIVQHMNDDHADALTLYAQRLLGRPGDGWTMTGIDPDGIDLLGNGERTRLSFARPVHDGAEARAELVRLVEEARRAAR